MMAPATGNMSNERARGGRVRRGFSLAELMISIGILAVGLTMAGALFPAALHAGRESLKDVLGSIICENGLALAKARWASLTDEEFEADSGALKDFRDVPKRLLDGTIRPEPLKVLADDGPDRPNFLTGAELAYPLGDETSMLGFVLMMRPVDDDKEPKTFEGYQLVATSYRRSLPPPFYAPGPHGLVVCRPITGNLSGETVNSYRKEGDGLLRAGSPLIERATGSFATITQAQLNGVNGMLDHTFKVEGSSSPFFVVVEINPLETDPNTGEKLVLRLSPAMATMVTRTGLTGQWVRSPGE